MKYNVTYSDDLPEWVGGRCYTPTLPSIFGGNCKIVIRPKYKDDVGLLNHEICHAKQYSTNWFHAIRYTYIREYRYKCELEAYTKQIQEYKYTNLNQAKWIVEALFNKYNLGLKVEDIKMDLINIISKV